MSSSLKIFENHSLKALNTLGLEAQARYFVEIDTVEALREALAFSRAQQLPLIPLGGGSNVVLCGTLEAVVARIHMQGRTLLPEAEEEEGSIRVRAEAGENWHDFVLWTLAQGVYGLENLSLIPGTVGAAPVQNIGAYGVELKDGFHSLEAMAVTTGELRCFNARDCDFGYRDSVFKRALRDQFIITSVTFNLNRSLKPHLDYGQLSHLLRSRLGSRTPTGQEISQAVSDIRREKLPDPSVIANAGSFFKNPLVTARKLDTLRQVYPDIVAYPAGDQWKLAAGWLIDRTGMRGIQEGNLGTYQQQALVLVNHGVATGEEVMAFSETIRQRVLKEFGVSLEREPRVY